MEYVFKHEVVVVLCSDRAIFFLQLIALFIKKHRVVLLLRQGDFITPNGPNMLCNLDHQITLHCVGVFVLNIFEMPETISSCQFKEGKLHSKILSPPNFNTI